MKKMKFLAKLGNLPQGVTDKQRDMMHGQKTIMLDFFNSQGFKTIGELEGLTPESIRGNAIVLHGEAVGHAKPLTGKTASAVRRLPICPTAAKNIRQAIKRYSFAKEFKGIHPHRFRHTFAVNKLLSQTATLEMVKYQLGHSDISTTANDYREFIPEHFKAGFEEAIRERRELVEWLENGYFL